MKLEFPRQIFEKYSNIKFQENPSDGSAVPCGRTDRHDERNSRFSEFCERIFKHPISINSCDCLRTKSAQCDMLYI
jgi:hypothetical protein